MTGVLEDSLHIEPVGGASLVVGAPFQVIGQLAGARVVNHPRLALAYGVCGWERGFQFRKRNQGEGQEEEGDANIFQIMTIDNRVIDCPPLLNTVA